MARRQRQVSHRSHRCRASVLPVPLLDLAGVLSMGGRALGITRKRSRVPDPELRRDEPDHSIGNLRRARQEDAEESDRPQLDCKPEPILIPSARGNHRTIMGVEMKVPSELLGRRLSGILAVGGSLRFAQEVDRHRCPEKRIVFGERNRDRSHAIVVDGERPQHLPTTVSLNPWPITPIFECPPTRRTSRTRSSQCSTIATLKALLRSSLWRTPPAVGGLGETGRSGDCSRRRMRVTCWSQPRSLV